MNWDNDFSFTSGISLKALDRRSPLVGEVRCHRPRPFGESATFNASGFVTLNKSH